MLMWSRKVISLKIKNLNFTSGTKGPTCITVPNQNQSKGGRYGDLTVFIMAAVGHLGFLAVKRPILHHRTKFRKDW